MSAPSSSKEAPKPQHGDPMAELAEKIFVALAGRIYGNLAGGDVKKPDPKALATYSYKLAEAFEQASKETDRARASIEAANNGTTRSATVSNSSRA